MHLASMAPNAAPNSPSPLPAAPPGGLATPFSLTPGRDDTALYQDARASFSHLLPGRPTLGMATLIASPAPSAWTPQSGEPPADATIHLQDAPITIRYRLEPPSFAASSAAELARGTAEHFASWRAHAQVPVEWANDSWLVAWGVEAAAVAAYDVAASANAGAYLAREDLFVLVRQGMVMLVSWTYPRGFVDDPAFATFASVGEATMVWDPARWEQRGRVWPDGAFLGPGLFGATKTKYEGIARQLSAAPIAAEERMQVLAILSGVVSGAGAPWLPLEPDVIEGHRRAILSAVRSARLRAFVDEAFAEVRTAHDLRGLAIILGRSLDVRHASSIPPALPGTPGLLRPPPPPRIHY